MKMYGSIKEINTHRVAIFPLGFSTRSKFIKVQIENGYVHERALETLDGHFAVKLPCSCMFKDGDSVIIDRVQNKRVRYNITLSTASDVSDTL